MRSFGLALAVLLLVPAAASRVHADEASRDEWGFVVEGGTQFPVFAGGGLRVKTPWNLDLRGDVGVLPQAYGELVNDIAQDLGGYDRATALLIDEVFSDSILFRVGGAWHVFGGGFYIALGYSYVDLHGSVTDEEIVAASISGFPDLPVGFSGSVPVDTTLHMLQGELGYEWEIIEHLILRLGIGLSFTVDGYVDFGVPSGLPPGLEREARIFEEFAEDYLEGILTDYVHTPTGTIALGYRF